MLYKHALTKQVSILKKQICIQKENFTELLAELRVQTNALNDLIAQHRAQSGRVENILNAVAAKKVASKVPSASAGQTAAPKRHLIFYSFVCLRVQ